MTDKIYNTVSKYQFPMLREFCLAAPERFVSMREASKLDQRPLGSLYHRGWIGYRTGKGFYATAKGVAAFLEYANAEARQRKRPELPLSHYFDPTIYQLHTPLQESKKKRKAKATVREMLKIHRGAA